MCKRDSQRSALVLVLPLSTLMAKALGCAGLPVLLGESPDVSTAWGRSTHLSATHGFHWKHVKATIHFKHMSGQQSVIWHSGMTRSEKACSILSSQLATAACTAVELPRHHLAAHGFMLKAARHAMLSAAGVTSSNLQGTNLPHTCQV